MSNRHLSRTIALQTLFEWDFYHRSKKLFDILTRNIHDFAPDFNDGDFTQNLVKGITKNLPEIDSLLRQHAPEWPLEQITLIDRNILRLGIYELRFERAVPPKVVINEAIELAKTYGGPSSHKFVNGVLGSLFKDSANPDSLPSAAPQATTDDQLVRVVSAGGVVFRRLPNNKLQFALIKDAVNKWTFPKGKVGDFIPGEGLQAAAEREIKEELGIKKVTILDELGKIDVTVNPPDKPSYPKEIYYFLAETQESDLQVEAKVTIKDAKWFDSGEILGQLGYKNSQAVFQKAMDKLNSQ